MKRKVQTVFRPGEVTQDVIDLLQGALDNEAYTVWHERIKVFLDKHQAKITPRKSDGDVSLDDTRKT